MKEGRKNTLSLPVAPATAAVSTAAAMETAGRSEARARHGRKGYGERCSLWIPLLSGLGAAPVLPPRCMQSFLCARACRCEISCWSLEAIHTSADMQGAPRIAGAGAGAHRPRIHGKRCRDPYGTGTHRAAAVTRQGRPRDRTCCACRLVPW